MQSFEETIYMTLYGVFKAVGHGLSVPQMEALRNASDRFAQIMEAQNKAFIIEKLELIQTEIQRAFKIVEERLDKIEQRLDKSVVGVTYENNPE